MTIEKMDDPIVTYIVSNAVRVAIRQCKSASFPPIHTKIPRTPLHDTAPYV